MFRPITVHASKLDESLSNSFSKFYTAYDESYAVGLVI